MRIFWMKLHAYLACFFLPLTILYLSTGLLHLFDIEGSIKNTYELEVPLPDGWIQQELAAKQFVEQFLLQKKHSTVPELYYREEMLHNWYDRKHQIVFVPAEKSSHAKIIFKEHDLLMQLMFIHKGIAGKFFWILGVLFGLHLLISVISGIIMVLKLPGLKTTSLLSLLGGFALLVVMILT